MAGAMQDRGTFRGIATTLLSLALLAERAAGRSLPVRLLVLVLLGRAEKIARAFVAREMAALIAEAVEAGCPCPDILCPDLLIPDEPSAQHCGAAEAQLLALRLRILAALLGMLAGEEGFSGDRRDGLAFGFSDGFVHSTLCAGGAKNLPLLLVVRRPAARRLSAPHDTS